MLFCLKVLYERSLFLPLPDVLTLLFILADQFVTKFSYNVFYKSVNRRGDGIASVTQNYKYIQFLHDLPDFYAQREIRLLSRLFSIAASFPSKHFLFQSKPLSLEISEEWQDRLYTN